MTNTTRYLEARYAIVQTEKLSADRAYSNARLAEYEGHKTCADFMTALDYRRHELAQELEGIAEQIRAVAGDEAEQGARQGAQEASNVTRW